MRARRLVRAFLLGAMVAALALSHPPQATALHVACGQTITEDTTLDTPLLNCVGDGIVVGADDITVDLNGQLVDGDGVAQVYEGGIDNIAGHDGVTIKNGTISEFRNGVVLGGVDEFDNLGYAFENLVQQVTLVSNGFGVVVEHSDRNRIYTNLLDSNGTGIRIWNSTRNVIANNTASANTKGIVLEYANENNVTGNYVKQNHIAFELVYGERNNVDWNYIANSRFGIELHAGNTNVRNNLLWQDSSSPHGSAAWGISLFAVNGLSETGPYGPCDRNYVAGNTAVKLGIGFYIGERCHDNIAIDNAALDNLRDGFWLQDRAHWNPIGRNMLYGNTANRNGRAASANGIYVTSPHNIIRNNVANENANWGIRVASTGQDGGGNRAAGNVQPQQCQNVACN